MRTSEHLARCRLLDDPAGVHREDPISHLGDNAEIMGDEHHRRAVLALETSDQVEQLGLDGDVKGGGRFVGDQQLGPQCQCHRQHHPLAHAAGELMGIVVDSSRRVGNADFLEQGDRPLLDGSATNRFVGADRLTDLPADGVLRVQARQRILEHHGDPGSADPAHCLGRQGEQVEVVESRRATHPRSAHELEHGLGRDRLARAGLSDDADGLAGENVEGDAADGVDVAVLGREGHREIGDGEQRAGRHRTHLPR